ncbi:hypothetical protein KVG96_14640 [Pseudomonas sp. COR58]|uniref:Uncharacterized protein n=1 Tax=Pseudomonas ekonensis TaxID=2842353 RepID=A0ABS6PFD7_9PSED|nr:hypothetical protein [Pseudomonas ekonensis]MBV4459194.1 hypothetical protein [Pseudomonas ekonensis]
MSLSTMRSARIAQDAEAMHSSGYFVDAIGRLFQELASEAPDAVDRILNGYTLGGIAAGLRIVGGELMARGDDLKGQLGEVARKEDAA